MYDIDPGYTYYDEAGLGFMLGFYLIYFLVVTAVTVGTYVLQSLSMHTIAKRRGIKKPWLAWIPVGSSWILGCISDQYRYVAKGQVKNKRKALLTLEALVVVLCVLVYVLFGAFLVQALAYDDTMFMVDHSREMSILGSLAGMLGVSVILSGLMIAWSVIQYMALFDLYHSCEPSNGTLYLVLSILFSITQPIFLLICRKKDGGMPPRKPDPAPYIPQPTWQPPQPPVEPQQEPWEKTSEE